MDSIDERLVKPMEAFDEFWNNKIAGPPTSRNSTLSPQTKVLRQT